MTVDGDACAQRPEFGADTLPTMPMRDSSARARALPADEAVTLLYDSHYAALVRATVLLVGDVATAEDVVEESFIAMHRAWWRLRDTTRAVPYLRRSVMNRACSVLRRRRAVEQHHTGPTSNHSGAEEGAPAVPERSSVLGALGALPLRQRQVIVLRYYAELSETQIANALGIPTGSVKSHATRAIDSLRRGSPEWNWPVPDC